MTSLWPIGLIFYICIFWTSSSIFVAVYVFPFEKMYLVKERKADMYRLSVYYVCSTMCDMVAHLLYPTCFMYTLYFMAGFKRTIECFFLTLVATLLIAITSQGAGELFGAAVMSIRRAGMVASLILMLFLLTGGYYIQAYTLVVPLFLCKIEFYDKKKDIVLHNGLHISQALTNKYKVVFVENLPSQSLANCVVFVASFAEHLIEKIPIKASDFNIERFRYRYAALLWEYDSNKNMNHEESVLNITLLKPTRKHSKITDGQRKKTQVGMSQ